MGFYRTIVAQCDGTLYGSRCFETQRLNPTTTQPYVDLVKLGWTVGDDGETLLCPRHKEDQR